MKLVWTALAIEDREAIYDWIDRESPRNAIMIDTRISDSVERLMEFPESGRAGRVAGTRELLVVRTPFIAVYGVADETIRILRVLHGAQEWPDDIQR